jgi:TolB-like protein
MKARTFLSELRERKVLRAAVAYGVVGWLTIQVADVVLPALALPEWTVRLVVVLVLLGFPLTLVLAWAFELTPDGLQRERQVRGGSDDGRPPPLAEQEVDRSIVILPFVNLSADDENEYFSDGLTDELISDLAQIEALRVISRTSSMQMKGTDKGVRMIGVELGVRYVLEGSVRRAGSALRITAQLIDARNDTQLWARKFKGSIDEVFDVQERVARAIVSELDVALSPMESARLRERPIRDVRAFELYLKARDALGAYDVARATPLIERAVSLEGEVPALRALRTMTSIMLLRTGASRDEALMDAIGREAGALIEDAPDQAYGHAILGFLGYERGDQVTAVSSLRRAMELDPADGDIHFFHGIALQAAGHTDPRTGLEWVARDPLSPLAHILVAANSWFVGDPREGLPALEEAVRLAPMGLIYHWGLGYHYALVGRLSDAEREAAWLAEHAGGFPYTAQLRALLAAAADRNTEALEFLGSVDESALDGHHTFHLAESYAMAGEHERAVVLLDRAVTLGFYPYDYYANRCPFYAPLREREDFARVVSRAAQRTDDFRTALDSLAPWRSGAGSRRDAGRWSPRTTRA